MGFKIFNEETNATNLRLIVDEYSGNVDVVAVDECGEPMDGGYICGITPEGRITLYRGVESDLVSVDGNTDAISVEDDA
jgi:hypothetical protein